MIEIPLAALIVWGILTAVGGIRLIIVGRQAEERRKTLLKLGDPLERTKILPHHYGVYWAIKYMHAALKAKEFQNSLFSFYGRMINSAAIYSSAGQDVLPREYQHLLQQLREEKTLSRDWSKNPLPSLKSEDIKNDNRKFIKYLREHGVEI